MGGSRGPGSHRPLPAVFPIANNSVRELSHKKTIEPPSQSPWIRPWVSNFNCAFENRLKIEARIALLLPNFAKKKYEHVMISYDHICITIYLHKYIEQIFLYNYIEEDQNHCVIQIESLKLKNCSHNLKVDSF